MTNRSASCVRAQFPFERREHFFEFLHYLPPTVLVRIQRCGLTESIPMTPALVPDECETTMSHCGKGRGNPVNILIVESKAKVKPIQKYLGTKEWRVLATGGHIRRLPTREAGAPRQGGRASWANEPGKLPDPPWAWTERGEAAVEAIRAEAQRHVKPVFFLASDPDREGELIAWHLASLTGELGPCHRITFQEITKPALLKAIATPGKIDQKLVDAALVRAFLDRLAGWRGARFARRFVKGGAASMGRVQTPTLGFVVDRELERRAFVSVKFLEVHAEAGLTSWRVFFHDRADDGAWRDDAGSFNGYRTSDRELAERARDLIERAGELRVSKVTSRQSRQAAPAPFTTDKLLHSAGSRWGWSPGRTSRAAGALYEAGLVTYIRTDSTRLSEDALVSARALIGRTWSASLVGQQAPQPVAASAQDAHEAIRPTDLACTDPDSQDADGRRLYALIRAQTLASQMVPSSRETRSLQARVDGLERRLEGSVGWYSEPGWRRAFASEELDGPPASSPIHVESGARLPLAARGPEESNPELREGETQPPARYRAHTLIAAMKASGIGRPSTYAKTVEKLQDRGFVVEEGGSLAPSPNGESVWLGAAPCFTLEDGSGVFDTQYTASMEARLDDIAQGLRPAPQTWEAMREAIRTAHTAALAAAASGKLLPRVRGQLQDLIDAHQELADEVGPLDELTQEAGRGWIQRLRQRQLQPSPTTKQTATIKRLLEQLDLDLPTAADQAGLELGDRAPDRREAAALIDLLLGLRAEHSGPSERQITFISSMATQLGLDEAAASELVGCGRFSELSGGREGTASALISALKARRPRGKGGRG